MNDPQSDPQTILYIPSVRMTFQKRSRANSRKRKRMAARRGIWDVICFVTLAHSFACCLACLLDGFLVMSCIAAMLQCSHEFAACSHECTWPLCMCDETGRTHSAHPTPFFYVPVSAKKGSHRHYIARVAATLPPSLQCWRCEERGVILPAKKRFPFCAGASAQPSHQH